MHHPAPPERPREPAQHLDQAHAEHNREQRECEVECVHRRRPITRLYILDQPLNRLSLR